MMFSKASAENGSVARTLEPIYVAKLMTFPDAYKA